MSRHCRSDKSVNSVSSVDYFLLDANAEDAIPPPSELNDVNREQSNNIQIDDDHAAVGKKPSHVDVEAANVEDMHLHCTTPAANRSRLGSSQTNMSSAGWNSQGPYGEPGAASSSSVERIYFHDTAGDAVSTILQRGESSYSLPLLTPTTSSQSRPRYRRARTMSGSRRHLLNDPRIPLSGLNILNAFTYSMHLIIWWSCAVWGLDHIMDTHWEQTQQNETLVTPATWAANYLWIPILTTEAMFTVAQLLPHYRARPIVTSGTSFFFFYTVLLQIMYTFLYSFGLFVFSFICVVLALISILSLLASQQYHAGATGLTDRWGSPLSRPKRTEYFLFSFPFYLHAGWLILMAVDHFSLLFRRYGSTDRIDAQLAADMVALGALLAVAVAALQSHQRDFVIPTVILWSYVRTFIPRHVSVVGLGLVYKRYLTKSFGSRCLLFFRLVSPFA
jgi:hypothetical protein